MDPVTHGLVGAAAASWTCPIDKIRAAAALGALAAMAPDLDVLLNSTSDPLFQLEMHRQFSHSLLFAPLGALMVAGLAWWLFRKWLSAREVCLAALAGFLTAGPLDACTSYGTQLLWPVSTARVAWNLTPVVEPIFTLTLLALCLGSLFIRPRLLQSLALVLVGLFLSHGALQQSRALATARFLWEGRHHQPERVVVKPTLGNQILWRVNYVSEGRLYTDAVRTGIFGSPRLYPGESRPLVRLELDFAHLKGTRVYRDLERFSRLSEGYLIRHPDLSDVVGDGRYAMLPTSLSPLWGLRLTPEHPDTAPEFVTFRDSSSEVRQQFWAMLSGR